MVKLAPKLVGHNIPFQPGFNPSLNEVLKTFPGVHWSGGAKAWMVPIDVAKHVELELGAFRKTLGAYEAIKPAAFVPNTEGYKRLHDYQQATVAKAVQDRARLIAYETGVGKTPTACVAVAEAHCNRVIVICPGTMRQTWAHEMEVWSGRAYETLMVMSGKDWAKLTDDTELIVVTYELLKKAPANLIVDAIIVDESHHIKNGKAAKSRTVLDFRLKNPRAMCLLLTATPIANQPVDVWHQLTVLWPGRFGTYWQFATRYANVLWNGYGHLFTGVNDDPDRQKELKHRLDQLADRVTKLDVAHLLPPLNVRTIRVPFDRAKTFRELEDTWRDPSQAHKFQLDLALMRAADSKLSFAKEHVKEKLEDYNHIVVFTYRRDYAAKLAEVCKDRMVQVITGDVPAAKRNELLEQCRKAERSLVCATMDSIGEGIDLTYAQLGIIAELTWKPKTLNQVLGRFCRLSGKHSVDIEFLILESTIDEHVGLVLLDKVRAMNGLLRAGKTEAVIQDALDVSDTDEGFLTRILEVANSQTEKDVYY